MKPDPYLTLIELALELEQLAPFCGNVQSDLPLTLRAFAARLRDLAESMEN